MDIEKCDPEEYNMRKKRGLKAQYICIPRSNEFGIRYLMHPRWSNPGRVTFFEHRIIEKENTSRICETMMHETKIGRKRGEGERFVVRASPNKKRERGHGI